MENNSGEFRKKKIYFTQASNEIIRDCTVSTKAKGLYLIIQSYITLEDFTLYKNFLKKQCKEKDSAFDSMWKELKALGWLVQYKEKNDKGQYYYEYDLLDKLPKKTTP